LAIQRLGHAQGGRDVIGNLDSTQTVVTKFWQLPHGKFSIGEVLSVSKATPYWSGSMPRAAILTTFFVLSVDVGMAEGIGAICMEASAPGIMTPVEVSAI